MRRTAAGAVLLCLLAGPLPATTLSPFTTADLVRRAERVCCGRCERVEPRLHRRTGLVFTHVTLRLLEDLKGRSTGREVRLRIVGGRAGGVATIVPGMPRFRAGVESVLLLGSENRAGHPVVLDGERGVLPLEKDAKGRRHLARRVTGFREFRSARRVSLDAFRSAVRRIAKEKGRREDRDCR